MGEERHLLVYRSPVGIHSWEEWRKYWEQTDLPVEFRESLLFRGFGAEAYDWEESAERIKLYLCLADGYLWENNFTDQNPENEKFYLQTCLGNLRPCEIRQSLARKTFETLCLHVFKNTSKGEFRQPDWARLVADEEILKAILFFFRLGDYGRFKNLPDHRGDSRNNHHTLTAVQFLRELVFHTWPVSHKPNWWSEGSMNMFRCHYPQFIEILAGLGELDSLIEYRRYKEMTFDCFERLRRISLAGGKFGNLEEAIYNGSAAARVLYCIEVIMKEEKRLA